MQKLFKGTRQRTGNSLGSGERRSKTGKAGIQFLRILNLGHNEDDTAFAHGNGFYHQRNIICLKANLGSRLLHHFTEEIPRLFCAVGQFTQLDLTCGQIFSGQCKPDLIVTDLFYFQQRDLLPLYLSKQCSGRTVYQSIIRCESLEKFHCLGGQQRIVKINEKCEIRSFMMYRD
jgi:hypothetical protein